MMLTGDAMAKAILLIADKFGKEYVKNSFAKACVAITDFSKETDAHFEYFCGFSGDRKEDKWTVFARVRIDCETGDATFLDYRLLNGKRMEKPIKPVRYS